MVSLSALGAISLDENGEVKVNLKANEKGRGTDGLGRMVRENWSGKSNASFFLLCYRSTAIIYAIL